MRPSSPVAVTQPCPILGRFEHWLLARQTMEYWLSDLQIFKLSGILVSWMHPYRMSKIFPFGTGIGTPVQGDRCSNKWGYRSDTERKVIGQSIWWYKVRGTYCNIDDQLGRELRPQLRASPIAARWWQSSSKLQLEAQPLATGLFLSFNDMSRKCFAPLMHQNYPEQVVNWGIRVWTPELGTAWCMVPLERRGEVMWDFLKC
jgi:hypothetical protein